ncbi:MAG: SPOR domain-containing protein [Candidatus Riflebacteria bacterium]|nr:SPOR domain-containing protein [Candidatus Riflebacteria bacterium]
MKDDNRRFDWGPPQKSGDAFKDFVAYFFIVLILGFGVWLLSDTSLIGKKNVVSSGVVSKSHEEALPIINDENLHKPVLPAKTPAAKSVVKTPALEIVYKNKAKYYVQLGAFEDKASADEVMNFLTENGFSPILKSPDDQFEIYRVLVGPFDSEADADYRSDKLNELGLPSFVVEY